MVRMMSEQAVPMGNYFLRDIVALHAVSRIYMGDSVLQRSPGAVSNSVRLLQTVLTAEIVCVLRYTRISVSEAGLKHAQIGAEFQEQANDERRHMATVAERIMQLGGTPAFSLQNLASRIVRDIDGESFTEILRNNLLAEQNVIEHYRELIEYFSVCDPATQSLLEDLLEDEENHMVDMQDLLLDSE
jgi:bacterioferritin